MIEGSCLCGGVRYAAEGPLSWMARCHCTQCRKASGAEFATNASVPASSFRVLTGQALLSEFAWSEGEVRVFCGRCGSPLFKRSARSPSEVRIRLGTLDTELEQAPRCHVFVEEKPAWSEITDSLPQYARLPTRA